ncbi:MAG: hypothetical protein ACPHJY_00735 [Acidimicrobiales bacterium]
MAPGLDFDPERFERQSFELVRRGFEPSAVQRELQRAAAAVRELQRQVESLGGQLRAIQSSDTEPLEARRVAEALGAEATKVLDAAHAAAVERAERAEREAEAVREEAIAAADAIRAEAESERERILEEAAREAEAVAEDGRQRGREMVNEAQVVRERMLGDLARKRQTGRAQVEQLRAGRDRLLESLSIAQSSLDTAMKDLVESVPEARAAAERAGIRISNEPTPSAEVMEAEIESARLVGHPLIEGLPEPGLADEPASPDPTFITAEMEALTHVDAALEAESRGVFDQDEADGADAEAHGESDGADAEAESDVADVETDVVDADGAEPEAEGADAEEVETVDDDDAESPAGSGEDADDGADPPESADADAKVATPADDIFARLRESQASDDGNDPSQDEAPPAEPENTAESANEPDGVTDIAGDTGPPDDDESPVVDPDAEVVQRAVGTALRAVKKVLVEEQGILLDGIRQHGGDAISSVVEDEDAHASPYESAAEPAFVALAEALGGTGDNATLEVGFAQIRAVALVPVRRRLLEACDASDDADELTDTVRGLYRETRARRLPSAVAAAVAAVRGAVAIATASGQVRWQIDPAGPCGADCADNALAGGIEAGSPFPTGALHPPTDSSCTCWLVTI